MKPQANRKNHFVGKRIPFNFSDLVLLIDELNFPALLYDRKSGVIQCGNVEFIEATGIGNTELAHLQIHQILQHETAWESYDENIQYRGDFTKKDKSKSKITFSIKHIQSTGNLSLLMLQDTESAIQSAQFLSFLSDAVSKLFLIALTGSLSDLIDGSLQAIKEIFNIDSISVYTYDNDRLTKQKGIDDFPAELPLTEIERIQNLDMWHPGKRVLCEAHRLGRRLNYSGLLSVPFNNQSFQGLYVLPMASRDFFEDQKQNLEIFFNWLEQILSLCITIKNKEIEKEALQNQVNQLNAFAEYTEELFLILNDENFIEYANKPFITAMNYSFFEIINKNVFEIIDNQHFRKLITSDDDANSASEQTLIELFDRNGNKRLASCKLEYFETTDGTKKTLLFSDKTTEIELESSISKIEKLASLGGSIADFAHDARNPLNNISTGLQLLRKMYSRDESMIEIVDQMQSDCIRMTDMIESVLSFARQDAKEFKEVNLGALISDVFKRFDKKFARENIIATINQTLNPALIFGDYRSIERVFINLISNSIESMEKNGGEFSILIKANPQDESEIEVNLADTGPGIPNEILQRIFDPYVTGKKTGTGLGLPITKRIIDAHNARIEIQSFTSGTIFRLFFKLHPEEEE